MLSPRGLTRCGYVDFTRIHSGLCVLSILSPLIVSSDRFSNLGRQSLERSALHHSRKTTRPMRFGANFLCWQRVKLRAAQLHFGESSQWLPLGRLRLQG